MTLRSVLTLLVVSTATACAADSTYGGDRFADLGDMVDLRYGRSMGLGVKLEATQFLGAGLGCGAVDVTESYGRDEVRVPGMFLHLVVIGAEGLAPCGGQPELDILGVNVGALRFQEPPKTIDWFRFGGELVLPFVTGGLYLNVGQLVDAVAGITTLDPAGDDQATEIERERQREEAQRADSSDTLEQGQD